MSDITTPSRMHPAAPIVGFFFDLRKLIPAMLGVIPLVFFSDASALFWGAAALILFVVISLASPLVRYLTTYFHVVDGTLVIERGLIFKSRRVIPRARIQSVDQVRRLWHQLTGVVELRVEAIGGSKTEARLDAVSKDVAEAIRSWALEGDEPEPEGQEASQGEDLASVSAGQLVLAGLTGGRVAVIAVGVGYVFELMPEDSFEGVFDQAREVVGEVGFLLIAAAVAAALIVSLVISVVATVVVFWGFTVTREKERLIITRGLLERRRASIPLHRIQSVRIEENLVRKLFGLASLRLHVAGYAGDDTEVSRSSVLLPIGRRDVALDLAVAVIGAPDGLPDLPLTGAPKRAFGKRLIVVAFLSSAATIAGLAMFSWAGLAFGLSFLPLFGLAFLAWRFLGHRVDPGWAVVSGGILAKKTSLVPIRNVQHLSYRRGPVDRSFKLCDLVLSLPKSSVAAEDLDSSVGEARFLEIEQALLSA